MLATPVRGRTNDLLQPIGAPVPVCVNLKRAAVCRKWILHAWPVQRRRFWPKNTRDTVLYDRTPQCFSW